MSFAKAFFLTMLTCALAGAVVIGVLQLTDAIDRPSLPATRVAQSAPPAAPANPVVKVITETEPLTFSLVRKNLKLDQVISPCGPRTFFSPDTHFYAFDLFACAVSVPARQKVEWLVTFPDGAKHCMISGKWQAAGGKRNDVQMSVTAFNDEAFATIYDSKKSQRGNIELESLRPSYKFKVTIDNSFEPLSEKFIGGEITVSFESEK